MELERKHGTDWDAFLDICRREGVSDTALRWYVVRVERYLKAHPNREPQLHDAGDVQSYLERAGRDTRLPGWLPWQLAHALQLFFREVVRAPWAATFERISTVDCRGHGGSASAFRT